MEAKDIINKYWDELEIGYINSVKCALIEVDSNINILRELILTAHLDDNEICLKTYQKLKEVKQEILNL